MAWERLAKWARQLVAAAVATRPVPRHIGFIMDGNRRYAEKRHMRKIEGHKFGYQKLIDALEWCLELGVECVSVYAFSIDNYKRSLQEVELLMELAEQKLDSMLEEKEVLVRHQVQVRVIGDLSLAPPSVQRAAARVMQATRHHSRCVLNICFSYTSSEEMLQALDRAAAARAVGSSSSSSEELGSSAFLDPLLYTQGCPPVDLLVRTSGETRLSDFLLWQSRHALLVFTPILWPDLGFLDLLSALVQYQRCKPALDRARRAEADALRAERRGGVRWDAAAAAAAAARAAALAGAADVCRGQPAATAAAGAPGSAEQQLGLQLWFPLRSPFLPEGRPAANGLPAPCTALPPLCTPSQAAGMLPPGASATAAALEAAAAALPCGPLVCACGSGSAGSTAGAADGVAMVKAVQLGGESPYAVASPELPSSPSARSTEGTPSPLPPKWGLRLRSPSSASMHSLTGGSPRLSNGGLPNGSGLLGGGSGGGLRFRSPSSHRLGSVDSFSSIDLYGDAQSTGSSANGGGGLAQQRQRPSYQDLLDAMQ